VHHVAGRTFVAGTGLDNEVQRVKDAAAKRRPPAPQPLGMLLSDGWKKKYMEHGKPLINFVLALANGGKEFVKVQAAWLQPHAWRLLGYCLALAALCLAHAHTCTWPHQPYAHHCRWSTPPVCARTLSTSWTCTGPSPRR
jgi:hypothetical protein